MTLVLVAVAASADDRTGFNGTWQLDKERSDKPDALFEAIEIPWYARVAAKSLTPTLVMRLLGEGETIEVHSSSFLGSRTEVLGEAKEQKGEDELGRSYVQSSHWIEGDTMRVERKLSLDSGATANVVATWSIEDADTIVSVLTIGRTDGEPLHVRRVFARQR